MKRFIALLLSLVVAFSLCGCEGKTEKAVREAQEQADKLYENYKEKEKEYNDLEKAIDDYKNALDKVDSLK